MLMADGRTRRIEDLRVGDEIIGTERRGRYRRYVRTEVLDHWSTIKPVWAVELEDGTRLLTSGDHRFLTERGWKHVAEHRAPRAGPAAPHDQQRAARHRPLRRPAAPLRGLPARLPLRPDPRRRPSSARYTYDGGCAVHRFRLALSDFEALRRAQRFLDELRHHHERVRLPGRGRRAPGDAGHPRAVRLDRRRDPRRHPRGRRNPTTPGARGSSPASSTPRARADGERAPDLELRRRAHPLDAGVARPVRVRHGGRGQRSRRTACGSSASAAG